MPGKVKNFVKEQTMIQSVVWGLFAAVIVCILGIGVTSFLIYSGKIMEIDLRIVAAVVMLLAVFCGGIVSVKLRKNEAAVISGITAASFAVALILVNIMFFDAVFSGIWLNILMVVLGWITSSLAGAGKKRKR